MARAKKTDRAEARRRYRAEVATAEGGVDGTTQAAPAATSSSRPTQKRTPAFSSPPGRMGIRDALRESIHPVDIRGDLMALPWLITRTKAVWLPILLSVGSGVAFALIPNAITVYLFQFFVLAPAIGSIFLAGFLAPRASWLIGIIVGLAAGLVLAALLYSGAMNHSLTTLGMTTLYDPAEYPTIIGQSLIMAIPLGALFAAAAAWYRRFLQLSNPNRGRRAQAKKPGADGRTRTAGTSKAR